MTNTPTNYEPYDFQNVPTHPGGVLKPTPFRPNHVLMSLVASECEGIRPVQVTRQEATNFHHTFNAWIEENSHVREVAAVYGPVMDEFTRQQRDIFDSANNFIEQYKAKLLNLATNDYATEAALDSTFTPSRRNDNGEPKKRKPNFSPGTRHILMTWLEKHLDHPYPTDVEKERLARQTGLSTMQICNWFINARRRRIPKMKHPGSNPGWS